MPDRGERGSGVEGMGGENGGGGVERKREGEDSRIVEKR
jgi:hypothetical protein